VGAAAVIELARHNPAHLLFTGRNAKSAEATISSARSSAAAAAGANAAEGVVLVPITFIECDLASLASVQAAADKVLALVDRLDVLVCNAGIMAQPAALSPDGYETHFATNHLGHALLTLKLLPLLEQTSATTATTTTTAGTSTTPSRARIIMISSAAWKSGAPPGGIVFDTLKTPQEMGLGGRWLRYGQSKLANLLWARELSARHPSVLSFSVTPGVVATGSVAAFGLADKLLVYVANAGRVKKVEEGAHNLLWAVGVSAAAAGDGDGDGNAVQGGGFYEPVGAPSVLQSKASRDPALAGRLWEWTLAELKPFL
jgi:NAD(P)-dependent dehydrogenase (short-subunit alcohol dehydrogenase family)